MPYGLLSIAGRTGGGGGGGAGAFNGGKSQVQSQTLLEGGDYPFINFIKTMQSWTYNNSTVVDPATLDTDGYLKSTSTPGISNLMFVPPSKTGSGTAWCLDWDGRGTINLAVAATGTAINITNGASLSNIGGGASNYIEFTFPATPDGVVQLYINGIASTIDYPHNMRLYMLSEKSRINSGEIFGIDFLNLLAAAKPGVIRFLNWQNTNYGTITTYASEKPESYYSYYADEYRSSITITSGGSGDNYTGAFLTGPPVDKMSILVRIDHNPAGTNWTFNLNGTGPLPMYAYDRYFYQNSNLAPNAGGLMHLIYDADTRVWFMAGGYGGNQSGVRGGPPPSILVKLCMKVGAHPYFIVPTFASDPLTDWVTSVDNYIKANAPSWMIPRYETPNENWNTQFSANMYSDIKSFAYWGTTYGSNHHYTGRMASKLGQAIYANRGNDKTKTQTIVGVQSSQFPSASYSNPRLNSIRDKGFMVGAFISGSANITLSGGNTTFAVNDPVCLVAQGSDGSGTKPGGFNIDTIYFVRTLAGSVITLSSTVGGASISCTANPTDTFSICRAISTTAYCAYNYITTVACTQYTGTNRYALMSEMVTGYHYISQGLNATSSEIITYASDTWTSGLITSYGVWFAWANSFGPAIKLCGYEGGYSPDYLTYPTPDYGYITNASQATSCVLTIGASSAQGAGMVTGNFFEAGMPLCCSWNDTHSGMVALFTSAVNVGFTGNNVNWSGHGLTAGMSVTFGARLRWNGSFGTPAPILPGIVYYVKTVIDANNFTLSATNGGAQITITGTPDQPISAQRCYKVLSVSGNNVTIELNTTGYTAYTPFTSTAAGAFSAGGTTIALTAAPNASVVNGFFMYDSTSGKAIGRVGSVSANVVTLDTNFSHILNSSSGASDTIMFGTGLAGYGNFEGGNGTAGGATYRNGLRYISKFCASWQADIMSNYNGMIAAGGEFPSCFQIAGPYNAWSVLDPDIYLTPTPGQWLGIVQFNN